MNEIVVPDFYFALRADLVNSDGTVSPENEIFYPKRAEELATGWDVRSTIDITIAPFEYVKIPLGFRAMCPEGFWYSLMPRSSSFVKKKLHALSGVIDQNFENEVMFAAQYIPEAIKDPDNNTNLDEWLAKIKDQNLVIKRGEAIAQLIPVRRQEMNVRTATNEQMDAMYKARGGTRGKGGFGSTDNKKQS